MKILLDSSVWIDYFRGGKYVEQIAQLLRNESQIAVSSLVIYEVFKKMLLEYGETEALRVLAQLKRYPILEVDEYNTIYAAKLSKELQLPMADSLIYATALLNEADFWTLDSDFKEISGVHYLENFPLIQAEQS